MALPTPIQQQRRARFESLLGLAAPFLDTVLALGDRVSRIVGGPDDAHPVRPPGESFELPPRRAGREAGR